MAASAKLPATASDAAPDVNVSRDRRGRRCFSAQKILEPLDAKRASLIPSPGPSGWQQGERPGRSARRYLDLASCERAWLYDEAFPRQEPSRPLARREELSSWRRSWGSSQAQEYARFADLRQSGSLHSSKPAHWQASILYAAMRWKRASTPRMITLWTFPTGVPPKRHLRIAMRLKVRSHNPKFLGQRPDVVHGCVMELARPSPDLLNWKRC